MKKKLRLLVLMCLFFNTLQKTNAAVNLSSELTKSSIRKINSTTPKDSLSTLETLRARTSSNLTTKAFRNFESLEQYKSLDQLKEDATLKTVPEGFKFETGDSLVSKKWLQMAKNTFAKIKETQNYLDVLTSDGLGILPVATRPLHISNIKYTMGVAKAVFKPAYTELTVFLKIETPKGTLILGGKDIKLSHEGGIIGDAKLSLISQFTMNFDKGKVVVTLKGSFENPATYALIDCSGFKELGIDADVLFSKGLIHPVDAQGKATGGYVESSFKTVVGDWNDIVINISLPEFGVKGLKGTTFRLNNAVLDFSDLRNDSSMPQGYLSEYYPEAPELWRGVYINTLEVVLPREFKKRNQDQRITFGASDLIIDSQGVTGQFYAENIISIDEGSASKWQFSLDLFLVDIEANHLKSAEFNGEIVLPVADRDRLKYDALILPDDYTLSVKPVDTLDFDQWNAKVTLNPESYLELRVKNGNFLPKANLHGSINIASGLGDEGSKEKETVNFKGIEFQNLLLQSESPKFSADYFGYKNKQKLANFPVVIKEIGLEAPKNTGIVNLIFDFNVNLTSTADGGNGGGTRLIINSELEDENGRDKWKFKGIDLERISIAMDIAGTQLKGAIFIFEDDPTYGTGFAGAVGAKFKKGIKLEVEAKALFGRTEDFRYWFADAQMVTPVGIPIFPGFSMNAFGGGMHNRMKMVGVTNDPEASHSLIGASSSGIIYAPDKASGMGMKAMVGIATQNSEDLFRASVEFGMTFQRSGGLSDVYFKGRGELISAFPSDFADKVLDKLDGLVDGGGPKFSSSPPSGAISADVFISYDFVNDIFQASSEVYVNFGVLKGVGNQGRAGWLDFYVSPDEWHLLVGTPKDPIGIALNLGFFKIETSSYFMTGEDIPSIPPPPAILAGLLGIDVAKLDNNRDLAALESGRGLAFGARISVDTGDLRFLIFYARFSAGAGVDVMVKDYGDAHCKGSTEQIGLNGWYASGQAYAYLQGEIGVRFRLFGKKRKIPFKKGGFAVLLQARLPNPSWFKGYMSGNYSCLGGLIKGRFRFQVELGNKCEIVGGSPIEGIVVIGDMSPKKDNKAVDVFTAPQVAFNVQLNKVFEIPDESGDRKYKVMLDALKVTRNNNSIVGDIEWNTSNDVAVFNSHEILPPEAELKLYVQVHFEEYVNGNWEIIKDDDGKASLETKEVVFKTGEAPTSIPLRNVEYMYPVANQNNFYREQYNIGYVKLKRGQNYLFETSQKLSKIIELIDEDGTAIRKPFTYNVGEKQLSFSIPTELEGQTNYNTTISLIPADAAIDSNVKQTEVTTNLESEGDNTITVSKKTISDTKVVANARELLTFSFRTSTYKTFEKKMRRLNEEDELYNRATFPYGVTLISKIESLEAFDLVELTGNGQTQNLPLVRAVAVLDDKYYNEIIYPLLYQNYPLRGNIRVSRDTDKVGVPPIEAVQPLSWYLTDLESGFAGDINNYNPYRYNLTKYYYEDYLDLRYQFVNTYENATGKLVTEAFPFMRKGKYKAELKYILPGQNTPSNIHSYRYTNPLYE